MLYVIFHKRDFITVYSLWHRSSMFASRGVIQSNQVISWWNDLIKTVSLKFLVWFFTFATINQGSCYYQRKAAGWIRPTFEHQCLPWDDASNEFDIHLRGKLTLPSVICLRGHVIVLTVADVSFAEQTSKGPLLNYSFVGKLRRNEIWCLVQ